MKTKKITLIISIVLLCGSTLLYAQTDPSEGRPRIGVLLDTQPLPDLLVKHLRLEPGQGIRISNIQEDSPAEEAGLQRDDIIIGFEGQEVNSNIQLIDAVKKAGVGAEVSMEVIQLGKRNVIKMKLDSMEKEFDLKYPEEAEVFQSWRPGKIFRFKPGDKNWMEMDLPFDDKSLDVYDYYYSDDGKGYSVTIEGNPEDKDALITVRIGNDSYQTAVGEIDDLPEKYRKVAQKALEDSRKHSQQRTKVKTRKLYDMPKVDEILKDTMEQLRLHRQSDSDEILKDVKEQLRFHRQPDLPKFEPDKRMFDKIEEQMRKMQQRLDELEKQFKNKEIQKHPDPESDKEKI
jgi:hypothetical protein